MRTFNLRRVALPVALTAIALPVLATAQTDNTFFNAGAVRIRYVDQGKGDPVILVHGYANSIETWSAAGVVSDLAKDHRVIAFDLRGHGQSSKPHEPTAYGHEMGEDIVRLLDHLGLQRAHIVGYSLGGVLTAQLLTRHPERFLTAILVAGPPVLEWTPTQAREAEQEASETERDCLSRLVMTRSAPLDEHKEEEDASAT